MLNSIGITVNPAVNATQTMSETSEKHLESSDPLLLESGLPASRSLYIGSKGLFVLERRTVYSALLLLAGIGLFGVGVVVGRGTFHGVAEVIVGSRPGSGLVWRDSLNKLNARYTRFDGGLFPQKVNKYRGAPSEEIDQAWARFTTSQWMRDTAVVLNVSAQEAELSMNDDQFETLVKLGDDNGGGYMGTIEMFHQLHCLNILRKWTYVEHYSTIDPFWTVRNDHRRDHTDHCIDMIRQALMCNGDTGLILFHWVKGMPIPSPNFHTMHQCLDPEGVLEWAKGESAPVTHEIEKQPGAKELDHFL